MKFCTKCSVFKTLTEFNRRSDSSGHRAHCKVCYSKDNSARNASKRGPKRPIMTPEQRTEASLAAARRYRAKPESKAKHAAYQSRRRADKLKATPKWLTERQKAHIAAFYECANFMTQYLETDMEVDHIVPLRGKIVSGLHVPWNLQVMSATGNLLKSNKLEVES